jgi:hypothetical protein
VRANLTLLGRRALAIVCVIAAAGATAQRAGAGPQPQDAPRGHAKVLKPEPAPRASAAKAFSASSTSMSSSISRGSSAPAASTQVPAVSQTGSTVTDRLSARLPEKSQRARKARTSATSRPPTGVRRDAAGFSELRPAPESGASWVLLAAGLVLVLLVIGETTFLGLAGSRFGVVTRPRGTRRVPPQATTVPIRRVLPRR